MGGPAWAATARLVRHRGAPPARPAPGIRQPTAPLRPTRACCAGANGWHLATARCHPQARGCARTEGLAPEPQLQPPALAAAGRPARRGGALAGSGARVPAPPRSRPPRLAPHAASASSPPPGVRAPPPSAAGALARLPSWPCRHGPALHTPARSASGPAGTAAPGAARRPPGCAAPRPPPRPHAPPVVRAPGVRRAFRRRVRGTSKHLQARLLGLVPLCQLHLQLGAGLLKRREAEVELAGELDRVHLRLGGANCRSGCVQLRPQRQRLRVHALTPRPDTVLAARQSQEQP